MFAYDVDSIDLQQLLKVKDKDDLVSVELVKEINEILKQKKNMKDV